jgi:hypothetical protein
MFVYIIKQVAPDGFMKIGISVDPIARLKQLQTGSFERLEIIHAAWLGSEKFARRLEHELHCELQDFRSRTGGGEWFKPEAMKKLKAWGSGAFKTRKKHFACAEFWDRKIYGTPENVLGSIEKILAEKKLAD